MSLTPQWLDELRGRITLSGVIGRTTRVTKAGREFKACCPFHNEKTPSFTINDEKGFYHCFGCGAHGDVIRWMTDQRGLSFMDAVKQLAEEAGMEMPAADPRAAQRVEQQKSLHDVMAATQSWFVQQLATPEGAQAQAYLGTRGFGPAIAREFGFGYAPEGRQALKAALPQFPEAMLIEAGLRIVVDEKEPYDRFRGRLMLPIHDARGRVIAFGGRILDKAKSSGQGSAPKYLNSPDTPLFDKGRTLYNHHRAGAASRRTGRLIVVEGYMDVIALAAAGFDDAVAPLGTALTETQIEMLWRLVDMPLLCFDGDAAGQRAAMRAVTRALPLLRPGHSLRIVRMPQGQDPDDLIKARGAAAMEQVLSESQGLLDTLWTHERDAQPTDSPEAKAGLKARLLAHVETIADQDIKAMYRRDLLEKFSDFAFPRRENNFGGQRPPFQPRRTPPRNGARGNWRDAPPTDPLPETSARLARPMGDATRLALTEAVVVGLARHPYAIAAYAELLAGLAARDRRIEAMLDHFDSGEMLETSAIITICASRGLVLPQFFDQTGVSFAFLDDTATSDRAQAELGDVIAVLVERPAIEAALAEATERFEREMSESAFAEQQRLRLRKLEFDSRMRHMAGAQGLSDEVSASGDTPNKMAE